MGLHTIYTLQFVYENAFCFAGAPTFFWGLPHGFSFSMRFSARVQALLPGPALSTQHCATQPRTICYCSATKLHACRSISNQQISKASLSRSRSGSRLSTQHRPQHRSSTGRQSSNQYSTQFSSATRTYLQY